MATRTSAPATLDATSSPDDAELERLASCIADGVPLGPEDDAAGNEVDRRANAGLRLIEKVAREFRRSAPATPQPVGPLPLFRFAGLDVLARIGGGSYGEVYRAYDPTLDHYVALKLRRCDADAPAGALLDEARHLARVRHPNIVQVYGAAIDGERTGLWTELIRGSTLERLLIDRVEFAPAEVRQIGRELCHALACIHRHGLVHGDLKPANVMRDDYGRVMLMDFGAARALVESPSEELAQGSLRYLPPETLRGGRLTPHGDIYALGVTLFRLLAGCAPYAADDLPGLLQAQDRGEQLDLRKLRPDVPLDLCAAIEGALATDPVRRHRSALAFAAVLDPAPAPARRHRAWTIAALAAAVAGIVVALAPGRPAPWVASATFYLQDPNGYRTLKDGDFLEVGDAFALEYQSTRRTWLYVIDDDGSEPVVLFPSHDLKTANPLESGAVLRLPGASTLGKLADWRVDRDAAREQVTVIAADAPVAALDAAMIAWPHAGGGDGGAALRGATSLTPAQPAGRLASARLGPALAGLDALKARDRVRVWQFTFPHAKHADYD